MTDLPDTVIKRIRELVAAEWLDLDDSLQQDLAKVMQGLINRGLSGSTLQISESKQACNRNLATRCEVVVDSMRRILNVQAFQPSETLAPSLHELFHELYAAGFAIVERAFHDAIPEQNRASFGKHMSIRYEGIRLDKYLVEVTLIADRLTTVQAQTDLATNPALGVWQEKLDYLRQQEAIASDPAQKFAIKKQIEEAKEKIRELGG